MWPFSCTLFPISFPAHAGLVLSPHISLNSFHLRQPNKSIQSVNAVMSIQMSTILSCRLYVTQILLKCPLLVNLFALLAPPAAFSTFVQKMTVPHGSDSMTTLAAVGWMISEAHPRTSKTLRLLSPPGHHSTE